nr:hypothetical protein CFP56_03799 [Quercus suber]
MQDRGDPAFEKRFGSDHDIFLRLSRFPQFLPRETCTATGSCVPSLAVVFGRRTRASSQVPSGRIVLDSSLTQSLASSAGSCGRALPPRVSMWQLAWAGQFSSIHSRRPCAQSAWLAACRTGLLTRRLLKSAICRRDRISAGSVLTGDDREEACGTVSAQRGVSHHRITGNDARPRRLNDRGRCWPAHDRGRSWSSATSLDGAAATLIAPAMTISWGPQIRRSGVKLARGSGRDTDTTLQNIPKTLSLPRKIPNCLESRCATRLPLIMTIGTLNTEVVLDQPNRICCGTEDTVTGNVVLTYRRTSLNDVELFGPLTITVTFHGRAKTKLWIRRGKATHIYRGRAPLFSITKRLFSGPFRAVPNVAHSFPFSFTFPTLADNPYAAAWDADNRFEHKVLPPTMSVEHHGMRHRFNCFNEYRIGADAQMSGIDIKVVNMHEDLEPHVLYEQPRTPPHAVLTTQQLVTPEHFNIQNEFLLPEADRPSGFKQKAKAMFKSDYYPQYPFDLLFSAPYHAYIGERLEFKLQLRTFPDRATAVVVPEITVDNFKVTIEAFTQVRADKSTLGFYHPESYATEDCFQTTGGTRELGPFSDANGFSHVVYTARLVDVPSSFSTVTTSRSYNMKAKFVLRGAEKTFEVKKEYQLVIHPPVEGGSALVTNRRPDMVSQPSSAPSPPEYETGDGAGPSMGPPDFASSEAPPRFDGLASNVGKHSIGGESRSQPVSKPEIFPVRQIRKLDILDISATAPTDQIVSSPVLSHIVQLQRAREQRRHDTGDDDGDLRRHVVGRALGGERERADDVAETERHEQDGVHGDLLRVAGIVGGHPAVEERKAAADGVGEIVADQLPGLVVRGQERHERAAEDARDHERDDLAATLVVATG